MLDRRPILYLSALLTFIVLATVGAATAVYACSANTAYSVTSSAPPPSANWTDTSGAVWTPAGGFPGCATGDSAADTNASPTILVVNSPISNPLAGLTLSCPGCAILIQSGGSLTLSGTGSIGGSSSIIVSSGGTLTIASGSNLTFNAGTVLSVSGGYVDVQSGGSLVLQGSSNVTSSGTVNVNGSMTVDAPLTIQSGSQLTAGGATIGGSSSIVNNGTITQNGADSTVNAILNNNSGGNVHVVSGALHLGGGGSGDAPFTIDSGAVLDFPSGTYTLTANGTVSGGGTLQVSGGTLSIGGVTSPNGFTMSAGTLTGAGFLTMNALSWSGGTMSGSGGTQLNGSGSGTLSGAGGDMTLDTRSFNDYGYINYTATTSSGSLYLTNGSMFSVYGTFDFQDDGSIEDGGVGGTLNIAPNGYLLKSAGSGTSTIFPASSNSATVLGASGTLEFAGNGTHSGSFFASSPGTVAFSAASTSLSGFESGDGTFSFPAGSTSLSGSYAVSGLTSITGGSVAVFGSSSTANFAMTSGTLNLQNGFTMTGTGTWSGGTMNGSSTFDVASGATLTIDCANGNTTISGAQLVNDGTVDYTAASPNELTLSSASIANNGLFDIQTDQPIATSIILAGSTKKRSDVLLIGGSSITNNAGGTFQKSAGSGTTDIAPAFTNAGTVLALSGTMNFTASYTQTGGTTTLGPGGIAVTSPMQLNGGTLNGMGTLTGDLQNNATVSPGSTPPTCTITVTGNYTQGATGALNIELGGVSTYDKLAVGGTATLDGTLNVSLINGYTPNNGDTFPVLTFATRSGDFAVKNLPAFDGTHGSFNASYTPTELDLIAVVSPSVTDLSPAMNGPASVNAAAALSYTIDITNNGPDATAGTTTVVDTLPAGATGASGSGSGWSCGAPSGGTITCTSTSAIASGSQYPTLTISMAAPPDGGSVANSATVSNANDTTGGNNTASANTTVVAQADLAIVKNGPNGVTAGQNINYTITITNNGPSSATNVTVSDTPPPGVTFTGNSGACSTPFPCNIGTLTAGQVVTINSSYSTPGTLAGNVTNTATVSATTADPDNANNSSSKTTNVGAQADLSILKSGTASSAPGGTVVYTLNYANAGPSPATNVVISDITPPGLAFVSNSGGCTTQFPCSIGTLAANASGSITSTYTVAANFTGGSITNTASIAATENDPNTNDNTSSATTTIVQQTDLSIAKSGPPSASPGSPVTYTITVSNLGPSGAANVTVTDNTPAGLSFVSNSGACTTAFPCNIGTLSAGQQKTITATFSVPANYTGATITNTASVSSSATDTNNANDSSTVVTPVGAQADLSITKTGPANFDANQDVTYTIAVTNNGPLSAANVFVTDNTPAGLTFVSNGGACTGAFPCALGTLAPSQSATITSTFHVPPSYGGSTISNTATVSSSTPDNNSANNSATAVTPRIAATATDLSISKTAVQSATPGSTTEFTITVSNNGDANASNVVITDPTPNGLTFVSNSGACFTPFPCTLPSLAAHAIATVHAHYFVQKPSGSVTNTASVSSSASDPNPSNNSSSATVHIAPLVCPGSAPQLTAPDNNATVASPVTLSWTAVPHATYLVTINGSTTATGATSLTMPLPNGNYTWTVTAAGPGGCAPLTSAPSSFTVCNGVAGAPVASAVAVLTTGQTITLSWTAVDGAAQYEVQEASDAAFTQPFSTTTGGTSLTITKNVTVATPFFYRVRGISACGTPGQFSATVRVVVVPLPSPKDLGSGVDAPLGSTHRLTFQVFIPGLPGITTSFVATVDKPWLDVTPRSGIIGPEGLNLTVSADPTDLPNGTWTGTVLVVYGTSGVSSRYGSDGSTPSTTSVPVTVNIVTPVTPAPGGGASDSALIIPSVGHVEGAASSWRSDIRVANVGAQQQKFQLIFNGGGSVKQTILTIDPGATTALDDIVRNWYGVGPLGDQASGVLTVQPLDANGHPVTATPSASRVTVVSTRTYDASQSGTLGQFIAATPFTSFIGRNSSAFLSLQQLAQSDAYRTNFGVVEAAGKSATALVSVFDASGTKLLDIPIALKPNEQKQINSFFAANGIPSLPNGRVEVRVTSGEGRVTAYASVIDNTSQDPYLVNGVPVAGAARFVVPGVANVDTPTASWRSDIRVFNGGAAPQTATLTFYPSGSAPLTQSVTVNPGEVKALDDVIHSVFGVTNAGGALHVTTSAAAPLVVTGRTYDQTAHGTLGQFIPAVTPNDAVGNGDRALQILQVEESSRYRTNIGLAEVNGKAVTAEITVALPDSKVSPTIQVPLAAYESMQIPVLSSLGLNPTYNARISVRVIDGDGKVTAYGSVIDNQTQDATYVPAQ
jgi:uncharacterized repeat protein (TIGR01451 family)